MKNESPSLLSEGIFVVFLMLGIGGLPISGKAQTDEEMTTACGRQAKEAGITGASAVSDYVAKCVSEKQTQRGQSEAGKSKDEEKDKSGNDKKSKEKAKKKDGQKQKKDGKKGKKS